MTRLVLLAAFAAAIGHLAWHALVGPPPVPEYIVSAEGVALCGSDPGQKNLYLRRMLHLSQRPQSAWLQAVAHDRLRVYVNGELLADEAEDGFPVAAVVDLAPHLQPGPNAIALVARQSSVGRPPSVAIDGAYVFSDGREHRLTADDAWRCAGVFDRKGYWWFEPLFDDGDWPPAQVVRCDLRAPVAGPPRAVTAAGVGKWVTPAAQDVRAARVMREFTVTGRPRQAWLRVTTAAAYSLAVNGVLIDEHEAPPDLTRPPVTVRRVYDITPFVRRGANDVTLALTSPSSPPTLLADLEVDNASGRHQIGTDSGWLSRPPHADRPAWQPCVEVSETVGPPAVLGRSEVVAISSPVRVAAENAAGQIGLVILVALGTALVCRLAAAGLTWVWGPGHRGAASGVVYLALVPAAVAVAAAALATYDRRVARQDVYGEEWVYAALFSVPAQWGVLALTGWPVSARRPRVRRTWPRAVAVLALLTGVVAAGGWLRFRDIAVEPLQWDEVENYEYTLGFLDRGYPYREVHPDLPPAIIHTSELMFGPTALAALAFDDGRYALRVPAAGWSVLTTVLLFVVGRSLFGPWIGLAAAALHALAPVVIAMSNFGRYFAQLQFFTLLTVYLFWLTIRGTGPLDRRALWGTALSFIAMYLTWEGSAVLALGLMAAALAHRRGRLRTVFGDPHVWLAMLLVLAAVAAQISHATLQKSQFLWYGTSLSDLTLRRMWEYPTYRPWFYVWQSGWTRDALLPLLGLTGAGLLAVRHAYRRPARFLLLTHLVTCLAMSSLVPAVAWRYIHHHTPLAILLASAALVAGVRELAKLARPGVAPAWMTYARGIAALTAVTVLALGSGLTVRMTEASRFRVDGYESGVFKFPDLEGPARYVREHLQDGDIVLATDPFQVKHLMGVTGRPDAPPFYWPESRLLMAATVDDRRPRPLDRRDGTPKLSSRESLEELFARHRRVWYVVQPERHDNQNAPEVSAFLREHMDVVYEDFEALVLFRGEGHRPSPIRFENEQTLKKSRTDFLRRATGAPSTEPPQ